MGKRLKSIKYTLAHRRAFLALEKELLGRNTLGGMLHDMDKVFLKLILPAKTVSRLHRSWSRHHDQACCTADYVQMAIDWECARVTKPDKPLDARQTLETYYPGLKPEMEPVLEMLGL